MNALARIEDAREPRFIVEEVVCYCTACEDPIMESEGRYDIDEDHLCIPCANSMTQLDLIAWFGGKYKRG